MPAEATDTTIRTPARLTKPPYRENRGTAELASIGKSVVVKGELSGNEDLYIDGQVEGSIVLHGQTVTVGTNARVLASIQARNLIVQGCVEGGVRVTDRVDLRATASLLGDIVTARISIEDGAFFKGTIEIQKPEPEPSHVVRTQVVAAGGDTSLAYSAAPVSIQTS